MKARILAVIVCCSLSLFASTCCYSQVFPNSLYDVESFVANGGFEGKQGKRVARAIISLGQREISRLRRIRNDRPLNDSELVQLERLSDVMSPITKQIPDRAFALNFMQDPSVAQDMFNLIGQERISQLTAEGTREILLSRVAHLRKSSDRPVTLLDDETIRSAISFSDEQATRLDEICENARDEYRKGSVEAYEEIEHLLVNHWEQLIGLLDSSQAKTCLLYTSPSPRDRQKSRMPSSA